MSADLTDDELLQDYRANRSDAAFAGIVRRYTDLVYSAALRQTRNPALAEDATQAVFLALARKVRSIRAGSMLPGWLLVASRREALGILRQHARRAEREQRAVTMNASSPSNPLDDAWNRIEPVLDEGLAALRDSDRDAIALHFLRGRTFRDVGAALGLSEEAARKRVARALDILRDFLAARGVAFPAATVAAALAGFAVQAAPAALAATVTASVAGAGTGGLFSFTTQTLKVMAWTKTKTAVVAVVAVAAIPIGVQWQENQKLRDQVSTLGASLRQLEAGAAFSRNLNISPDPGGVVATSQRAQDAGPGAPSSTMDIMHQAIALTSSGKPRTEAVKDIEPLLAQIPIGEIAQAAEAAQRIADRDWRTGFLHMLLTRWAKSDGLTAATFLAKNVKGEAQLPLLSGLLPAWASHDPEGAWQWFQKTARVQLNFDARGMHNSALKEMFVMMGRNDLARGLQRTSELQGIDLNNAYVGLSEGTRSYDERLRLVAHVDAIPDARAREESRKSVFSVWAGTKPAEAKSYVEMLSDPAARSAAAQHVGLGLMATAEEPAKSADWWLRQTSEADRPTALREITHRWAEIDLVSAADWLGKQGNGPEVDPAKSAFAVQAAQRAPETAIEWANSIGEENRRISAMRSTYRIWRGRNASAADAWLARSNLTADQREAVTGP